MRISDWSSDVCSSDLAHPGVGAQPQQVADREAQFGTVERVEMEAAHAPGIELTAHLGGHRRGDELARGRMIVESFEQPIHPRRDRRAAHAGEFARLRDVRRSEEHTYELQSLMRISYAVFCLKKKT